MVKIDSINEEAENIESDEDISAVCDWCLKSVSPFYMCHKHKRTFCRKCLLGHDKDTPQNVKWEDTARCWVSVKDKDGNMLGKLPVKSSCTYEKYPKEHNYIAPIHK